MADGLLGVPGLQRPIVQAPIGACAGPELVAAVAAAGGLGLFACTWSEPAEIGAAVAAARGLADGVMGGNLVLRFPIDEQLDALLAAGVEVVTFSWGQPGAERVARCHAAGARVGVQVGTASAVPAALADGTDLMIAQGVEAGGHVQSTQPLARLLDAVHEAANGVPLVAAGGLATADDVRAVLDRGAAGAMLGTRFVATAESRAHPRYKELLCAAEADAAALTLAFDGTWPFGPHRVLRNATLDRWEAAGCPWPGSRPGEGDEVVRLAGGGALPRYDDAPPLVGDGGDIDDACLYAGRGVGAIADLPPAGDVVRALAIAAR
ncbi:MAG: NAD(P)H-dependent flavin oxidoreductase [Gaiellales bacterium]